MKVGHFEAKLTVVLCNSKYDYILQEVQSTTNNIAEHASKETSY